MVAYSLGSVNLSPSADYISWENLPDYSIQLNLYLAPRKGAGALERAMFSIFHIDEDENQYVTVRPVEKNADGAELEKVSAIYQRVTRRAFVQLQDEYELW